MPLKFPTLFEGGRSPQSIGTLLYGPPGNGKSLLAKACATECEGQFYFAKLAELVNCNPQEAKKVLRYLFEMAKENSPSAIVLEGLDMLD